MLLINKKHDNSQSSSDKSSAISRKIDQELWETNSNCQIPYKTFRGHRNGVTCCHFCINDGYILSASKDGNSQLWNASSGEIAHTYGNHSLPVTNCKMSSDDTKILSSSWDKTLCFFDLETGSVLWRAQNTGIVMSCDLSPDGNYALSCVDYEDSIKILDVRTGTVIHYMPDFHKNTPTCCVFSPNSQRVASTGMDRVTKVWDLVSKKTTITLTGHSNIVSSCCFSENERFLATSSWDKSLQVWDISTGMFRSKGATRLQKGHEGSVSCCKFSTTGQYLISGGFDSTIVVWDMPTRSKKLVLKGHEGWVNGVDVSKDGRWILSCSDQHVFKLVSDLPALLRKQISTSSSATKQRKVPFPTTANVVMDKAIRLWNVENADHLPAVIENRKAMGLRIVKCERCGKPFSLAQVEDQETFSICVFCRLADPERNTIPQF